MATCTENARICRDDGRSAAPPLVPLGARPGQAGSGIPGRPGRSLASSTRTGARWRPPGKSRRAAPMACIGYFDRRHHAELQEDSWRTRTEPPFGAGGSSTVIRVPTTQIGRSACWMVFAIPWFECRFGAGGRVACPLPLCPVSGTGGVGHRVAVLPSVGPAACWHHGDGGGDHLGQGLGGGQTGGRGRT